MSDGFPRLPAGCDIRLDRESQESVIANIRSSITHSARQLADDLRQLGDVPLAEFLNAADVELEDVYKKDRTFTDLRYRAGLRPSPPLESEVTRALSRLLYLDDDARLIQWRTWLVAESNGEPAVVLVVCTSILNCVAGPPTVIS